MDVKDLQAILEGRKTITIRLDGGPPRTIEINQHLHDKPLEERIADAKRIGLMK